MSDRDYTNTPSHILLNTQESETESKLEAWYLAEYKTTEKLRIATWKRLKEIEEQIKETSSTTDTPNKALLGNLKNQRLRTMNKLELHKKNLRSLEDKQPLKNIVERHREKSLERFREEYKERVIKETQEQLARLRKNIEERQKQKENSDGDNHNKIHSTSTKEKSTLQESDDKKNISYFEQEIVSCERVKSQKTKQQRRLKIKCQNIIEFLKENILWLILALITIVAIISGVSLPKENWFRRLIFAPFVFLGGLTIWSGSLSMVEHFDNHSKLHWHQMFIFFIAIFSVVAFFMWIE